MRQRYQEVLHIWHDVAREPNLRRVLLAFIGFNVGEYATWIAISVFAYHIGGIAAAGLTGAVQLIPAALFAPVASVLGDRYRRDRLLLAGYLAQVVTCALAGIALLNTPPLLLVFLVAAVAATAFTLTRPIQGALLPDIARSVEELTAANVVGAWTEGISIFAGPLVTGVLLALVRPGYIFLYTAALLLISSALAAGVTVPRRGHGDNAPSITSELLAGVRYLAGRPGPRTVLSFLSAHFFLIGSMDVLIVILSFRMLHTGNPGVGFIYAAFGLGGLLTGGAMAAAVGQRRLVPVLSLGTGGWAAGLACVAILISPPAAAVFVGMAGAGRPLIDVAGRTLLQRMIDSHMLSRTFGLVEGLSMGSQAAGMALVPLLALTFGDRFSFFALASVLPLLLLLLWRPLTAGDSRAPAPDRIAAVRRVPFFAPLSMLTIERLALRLIPLELPGGSAVITEGEPGDRFYIVREGTVRVSQGGRELRDLGPHDSFGEIALLRDILRTATVTAATDVNLYALGREDFLQALTGNAHGWEVAESVADARLAGHVSPPV